MVIILVTATEHVPLSTTSLKPSQDAEHWLEELHVPKSRGKFAPRLSRTVVYLEKFTQAVRNMGGDTYDMANVLSTCLKGNALAWLRNQPVGSIGSWEYFQSIFVESFSTTRDASELKLDFLYVRMKEGERLHDFIQHFKHQLNIVPDVSPTDVIETFKTVVRNKRCVADIVKERQTTIARLMDIVKTSVAIEDQLHYQRELDRGLRPVRREEDKEKPKR